MRKSRRIPYSVNVPDPSHGSLSRRSKFCVFLEVGYHADKVRGLELAKCHATVPEIGLKVHESGKDRVLVPLLEDWKGLQKVETRVILDNVW